MKRKALLLLLAAGLCVGSAAAQFGGIVFDPRNYASDVLRYSQLAQQLTQLRNSYAELVSQYDLAVEMAKNLQNMSARYRAPFSQWRTGAAADAYGNTGAWIDGINLGDAATADSGYRQATTQLLAYDPNQLAGMNTDELARVRSQYATVELADGASTTAISTIGAIRGASPEIETQIGNLERDSLSSDPSLNTEVGVLNKINVAGVLTLQTLQDSNKLLASLLEEQTVLAKQQRETTANTINTDIERRANLSANLAQVTGALADSLENFRMP